MITCMVVAEWITAVAAVAGLVLILVIKRYDQDCKRRDILVEFMLSTYSLDHHKDKLLQKWYQIEVNWGGRGSTKALAALRETIEKFHARPEWAIPIGVVDGIETSQWQTSLSVFSKKRRALEMVNRVRVGLCVQLRKDMWLRRPSLDGIVPFEAFIKSSL